MNSNLRQRLSLTYDSFTSLSRDILQAQGKDVPEGDVITILCGNCKGIKKDRAGQIVNLGATLRVEPQLARCSCCKFEAEATTIADSGEMLPSRASVPRLATSLIVGEVENFTDAQRESGVAVAAFVAKHLTLAELPTEYHSTILQTPAGFYLGATLDEALGKARVTAGDVVRWASTTGPNGYMAERNALKLSKDTGAEWTNGTINFDKQIEPAGA